MITSIKNADYSFLFQEASEKLVALHNAGVLKGAQALTEDEIKYLCPTDEHGNFLKDENGNQIINRFTSLEQYFTRLGTLISNVDNPIKYLMLPLDEDPLEVDANTRTITVPANFKKSGVGVQGDIIAETLFLRIDRFFVDLTKIADLTKVNSDDRHALRNSIYRCVKHGAIASDHNYKLCILWKRKIIDATKLRYFYDNILNIFIFIFLSKRFIIIEISISKELGGYFLSSIFSVNAVLCNNLNTIIFSL